MNKSAPPDAQHAEIRSFGRKRARKPSPRGERLWREVLPKVRVSLAPFTGRGCRETTGEGQQPASLTNAALPSPLWLEIGFGGAEHLIWQADQNREVTIIGCEPFEDGVIKALAGIEERALSNVLIHPDDARDLLRALPDASLDKVFILFPDPWPKRKHVKRRLVSTPTLDLLARVMKPGTELRVGTDIGDYARTILLALMANKAFTWPATGPDDWRIRPDDWPETRYEQKAAREGRPRYYFRFHRT